MDSPYRKYFDTNYVPTVDETKDIHGIIEKLAIHTLELDAQFYSLQQQLDSINEQRREMHTYSEQHRALLSPMRKVSRDILEEIFSSCLPTDRNPCMSAVEAPMLLTRICSSWRQIAHTTPRLWAKIHIPLNAVKSGRYSREKDLLEQEALLQRYLLQQESAASEWLSRSSGCPLSISIYQTTDWGSATGFPTPELSTKYFNICVQLQKTHQSFIRNCLFPHNKRWRDLDLCVEDNILWEFVDLGLRVGNSQLTLNSLHVTSRQSPPFHPPRNSGLVQPPPIQWNDITSLMSSRTVSATFHLHPLCHPDITSMSLHVWGHLTELNLIVGNDPFSFLDHVNGFQFAATILSHCHRLVTLKLSLSEYSNDDVFVPQAGGDIILQHLTTLSICIPCTPAGLAFTETLYLPSLNSLEVDHRSLIDGGSVDEEAAKIMMSLVRETASLHTLKLCAPIWMASADNLIEILKVTPSLHCLKVSSKAMNNGRWSTAHQVVRPSYHSTNFHHIINDKLLRALMPSGKPDSEIICPRLEELECSKELLTDITETCLKEFAISRQNDGRVPSLRRISVFIDQLKQTCPSLDGEKVSLGLESEVYFRRNTPSYSPFHGFGDIHHIGIEVFPESDCYNEL